MRSKIYESENPAKGNHWDHGNDFGPMRPLRHEREFRRDVIRTLLLVIFVTMGWFLEPDTVAAQAGSAEGSHTTDLSSSFQCPEDYPSNEAKQSALQSFMQAYAAQFPNGTVHDLMLYRY